ncbi:10170_t:CDS:2 [Ambispora gerdemannii]|uniref:10170_t:CDS:1 n=1 Tax=Ambispora gerdemannii TaxID=144530 RepID=A0A9N8VU01_9GLOM|nr:10170_t:CDS:2 [Ambispora gerdemannii]
MVLNFPVLEIFASGKNLLLCIPFLSPSECPYRCAESLVGVKQEQSPQLPIDIHHHYHPLNSSLLFYISFYGVVTELKKSSLLEFYYHQILCIFAVPACEWIPLSPFVGKLT